VAVKPALAAPAGTVTVAGTATAALLLDKLTTKPPVAAAALSVTVQASVPNPVREELAQESAVRGAGRAVPVPLRLISAVALVEELLEMVSCPVAAPTAAGSNCTLSDTAWPRFSVAGRLGPDMVKPAAASVAELMVTGAVPVEVRVTDWGVAAVLTCTLPKATLVALTASVGTAAFNCRAKVSDTPPALAMSVTVCSELTGERVAVNPALVAPAGTVTVTGTMTAGLLLARLAVSPPLGAAAFSVTVQASVADPVRALLVQFNELNVVVPTVVAVPLRPITIVASLIIVN
jgi:hypothetical protein